MTNNDILKPSTGIRLFETVETLRTIRTTPYPVRPGKFRRYCTIRNGMPKTDNVRAACSRPQTETEFLRHDQDDVLSCRSRTARKSARSAHSKTRETHGTQVPHAQTSHTRQQKGGSRERHNKRTAQNRKTGTNFGKVAPVYLSQHNYIYAPRYLPRSKHLHLHRQCSHDLPSTKTKSGMEHCNKQTSLNVQQQDNTRYQTHQGRRKAHNLEEPLITIAVWSSVR